MAEYPQGGSGHWDPRHDGLEFLMRIEELVTLRPGLQYAIYRSAAACRHIFSFFGQTSKARMGADEPILMILGAGRSGNTLLRRSLMERGSIYIPPESYVLSSQAFAYLSSPSLGWAQQVGLVLSRLEYSPEFDTFPVASLRKFALEAATWSNEKRSVGGLICGLYRWLAVQAGVEVTWVGDKTPMNLARIGLISRMFHGARYIYIERDPVEVAFSYRSAGLYETLEQGALRWKQSREAWLRFRRTIDVSRYMEVQFAELVSAIPETTYRALDRFGIARRAHPIDALKIMGDVNARSHHAGVREGAVGVRGEVRALLTPSERAALRLILGDAVQKAGYEAV